MTNILCHITHMFLVMEMFFEQLPRYRVKILTADTNHISEGRYMDMSKEAI
jgi:hypothetical protein